MKNFICLSFQSTSQLKEEKEVGTNIRALRHKQIAYPRVLHGLKSRTSVTQYLVAFIEALSSFHVTILFDYLARA